MPQKTQAQRNFPASVWEVVLSGFCGKNPFLPFYTKAEKAKLEALLSGGATNPDEIAQASARYKEVQEQLDEAELRWLELSEIE